MSLCKSLDLSRRGSEGNHLFRLGRRRVRLVGPILFTTHKMERKGTWALNSEIKPGLVKTAIKSMKREHDAPRGRNFLASGVERQAILKCAYLSLVLRFTHLKSHVSKHQENESTPSLRQRFRCKSKLNGWHLSDSKWKVQTCQQHSTGEADNVK